MAENKPKQFQCPSHWSLARRLDYYSIPEPTSGCLLWCGGAEDEWGYGMLRWNGRSRRVHRLAWEVVNGAIPNGLLVLHSCDVPCCINLRHLRLGTDADNSRDRDSRGRRKAPKGEHSALAKLTNAQAIMIKSDGRRATKIARDYGVTSAAIAHIRKAVNWREISHIPTAAYIRDNIGVNNGMAKLTVEQVLAIRADTRVHRLIALDYKISGAAVCQIKTRKRWAHID